MSQNTEPVVVVAQGETKRFRVSIRNKTTGLPVPLTGALITSHIKKVGTNVKEGEHTIEPVDLDNGVFVVVLDPEVSRLMSVGRHVTDVRIEINGYVRKRPRWQYNMLDGRTDADG